MVVLGGGVVSYQRGMPVPGAGEVQASAVGPYALPVPGFVPGGEVQASLLVDFLADGLHAHRGFLLQV